MLHIHKVRLVLWEPISKAEIVMTPLPRTRFTPQIFLSCNPLASSPLPEWMPIAGQPFSIVGKWQMLFFCRPAARAGRRTGWTERRSTAASSTSPSGHGNSTRTTSTTTTRHGHRRVSIPPSSTSASYPSKTAACVPRTSTTYCSSCCTGNAAARVYTWLNWRRNGGIGLSWS
uniref:Uncharacterized protein n=1 Tax=Oryza punctata TaxID=4537 RepID=A0A0E0LYV4_ORYPU